MASIFIDNITLTRGDNTLITLETADKYVTDNIVVNVSPQAGSFNNQATSGVTYNENDSAATIIPAEGYLYLNKGWFDNTKISLGHLIPDDTTYENAGVSHILSGYEAYDTTGKKLVGTMATVNPTFDGGDVTVTPSVINLVEPKLSVNASGSFTSATSYGVTSTTPTGTDGTDYLTIDGGATVDTAGSVQAQGVASRGAVLYNGATTGFVDKADNTEALAASGNTTQTSGTSNIDVTITDNFTPLYIPVTTVSGTGGDVTATSGSATATISSPTVTIAKTGRFTDIGTGGVGASYGVTDTQPTGTDGTEYLMINIDSSSTDGSASGTATINYSRAAVTSSALARGVINLASGSSLLAADTGSLTQAISGTVSASVSGGGKYFIPIVTVSGEGGGVSKASTGSSVSISGTAPTVTISKTGEFTNVTSGGTGASYGVTTSQPTGSDGVDFLKIEIGGSSDTQTFTGDATIAFDRAAVVNDADKKGAISMAKGTSFLAAGSGNLTHSGTSNITASVSGQGTYYIPIVTISGTGGGVSKTSGSITVSGTNPNVNINSSGTFISDANTYGITTSQPAEGTDGTNYISLTYDGTSDIQTFTGTGSVSYTRAAVTNNGAKSGAINITDGATLLTSTSGTLSPDDGTVNVAASISGGRKFYVPVFGSREVTSTNGSISGTLSVSGDNVNVTPKVELFSGTGTSGSQGSTQVDNTYGVTTSKPSGDWVVLDPGATSGGSQTVTGRVTASYSGASYTVPKGITAGFSDTVGSTSEDLSGTTTIDATIGNGTSKYIPVVTPSSSVSAHTITKPEVEYTQQGTYTVNGTAQSSVPAGVIISEDAPNDYNSSSYIKVSPTGTVTNGSSAATASATIDAGITAGSNGVTTSDTKSVEVVTSVDKDCYIKVYTGNYSVVEPVYRDLSMFDYQGNAVLQRETANCYIVSETGYYELPLVYGCGIVNGNTNAASYTQVSGENTKPFYNYLNRAITSPFIETDTNVSANSAGVVLADNSSFVIDEVYLTERNLCRFLRFHVSSMPTLGGNATIAVKDSNNQIMWSWHIWAYPFALSTFTHTNTTNHQYKILDVNLGWVRQDVSSKKGSSPYYQWGRKDPMLRSGATASVGSFNITTTAPSVAAAIQNPNVFNKEEATNHSWWDNDGTAVTYYNYWDASQTATGAADRQIVKTVYDPCPAGFHIPCGATFTGFSASNGGTWDNGYTWDDNFFYAAGSRYRESGGLNLVGSYGGCWSAASGSAAYSCYLDFYSGTVYPQGSNYRASGFSVRPVARS